jgi:glucose/arabinose dehydrogenase
MDWTFQGHAAGSYAPVNGLKMYYEVHGKGEPVVLLHGSFMTITNNWQDMIAALSKTRQVIAVGIILLVSAINCARVVLGGRIQAVLTTLKGKILRIDVDNPDEGMPYGVPEDNPFADQFDAMPEIWAYGLRNPWRCSFDQGGDNELFCADVGQNAFEEVSIIEAGGNFGWRVKEGTHCFDYVNPNDHPEQCPDEGMIDPIIEYQNCNVFPADCEGLSVTGGYVYRGPHEEWQGKYFFGDWSRQFAVRDGRLFVASRNDDGTWEMENVTVGNMDEFRSYVLSFGQDNDGEVYVMATDTTGPVGGLDKIYRIVP